MVDNATEHASGADGPRRSENRSVRKQNIAFSYPVNFIQLIFLLSK